MQIAAVRLLGEAIDSATEPVYSERWSLDYPIVHTRGGTRGRLEYNERPLLRCCSDN